MFMGQSHKAKWSYIAMKRFFHIVLGALLGGVLLGIPCFYAGFSRGQEKISNIDQIRTACDMLLRKASTSNNPEELEALRRFSYDTLRAVYFSGDTYGYKYSPEEWEGLLSALLEYELYFFARTKTADEVLRKGMARHMDAYCRAMPFWNTTTSNRQESVNCGVFGIYLMWYKEADKSGFDEFCLNHTNNVYATKALSKMADLEERKKQRALRPSIKTKTANNPAPSTTGINGR
jgi:hypothetical protein